MFGLFLLGRTNRILKDDSQTYRILELNLNKSYLRGYLFVFEREKWDRKF